MHQHTATSPPIPVNSRQSSSLQEALQPCTSDHTRWSNTTGRPDRVCPQNRTQCTDQPQGARGTPVEALHGPNSANTATLTHWLCAHVCVQTLWLANCMHHLDCTIHLGMHVPKCSAAQPFSHQRYHCRCQSCLRGGSAHPQPARDNTTL